MVGFVLIVVLVVVALMVFLIISIRKPVDLQENVNLENMLSAILKQTTDCAIVFEPDYDSGRDLIKSCYENRKCTNLDKSACEYMEEYLPSVFESVVKSENEISAYEMRIYAEDLEGVVSRELLFFSEGTCAGDVVGTSDGVSGSAGDVVVELKACYSLEG